MVVAELPAMRSHAISQRHAGAEINGADVTFLGNIKPHLAASLNIELKTLGPVRIEVAEAKNADSRSQDAIEEPTVVIGMEQVRREPRFFRTREIGWIDDPLRQDLTAPFIIAGF